LKAPIEISSASAIALFAEQTAASDLHYRDIAITPWMPAACRDRAIGVPASPSASSDIRMMKEREIERRSRSPVPIIPVIESSRADAIRDIYKQPTNEGNEGRTDESFGGRKFGN
jgi:hypothetical protein